MGISTEEKICQDINLLQFCMKYKSVLNQHRNKAYKTHFWKQVLIDYNNSTNRKPKSVKQIRDRFKYLHTNFAAEHALNMKFNRNLYKGSFLDKNKDLIELLKETAEKCFHEITYDENKILVTAQDICPLCYTKKYENLNEDDFVLPQTIYDNDIFNTTEFDNGNPSNMTYQDVFEYECLTNKIRKSVETPDYSFENQYNAEKTLSEFYHYLTVGMNEFKKTGKNLEQYKLRQKIPNAHSYTAFHINAYGNAFASSQVQQNNPK